MSMSLVRQVLNSVRLELKRSNTTISSATFVEFDGKTAYYDCVLLKHKNHTFREFTRKERLLTIDLPCSVSGTKVASYSFSKV
jgi:hypothetical protein